MHTVQIVFVCLLFTEISPIVVGFCDRNKQTNRLGRRDHTKWTDNHDRQTNRKDKHDLWNLELWNLELVESGSRYPRGRKQERNVERDLFRNEHFTTL